MLTDSAIMIAAKMTMRLLGCLILWIFAYLLRDDPAVFRVVGFFALCGTLDLIFQDFISDRISAIGRVGIRHVQRGQQ